MKIKNFDYPLVDDIASSLYELRTFWYKFMLEILINRGTEHEIKKRLYNKLNINTSFDYTLHKPFIPYHEFSNISNEEDGNPIYYCEVPTIKRQIRVIHEDNSQSSNIQMGAWINKSERDYYKYDELVISLEPTNKSLLITEEISYCWLCNSLTIEQIQTILKKTIESNLTKT
ncbi:MAG: hypothetical protein LPK11_03415 [Chromatiaceae bacterium]|nr:hypothetical protein [Chromatiaceae bacterium]